MEAVGSSRGHHCPLHSIGNKAWATAYPIVFDVFTLYAEIVVLNKGHHISLQLSMCVYTEIVLNKGPRIAYSFPCVYTGMVQNKGRHMYILAPEAL